MSRAVLRSRFAASSSRGRAPALSPAALALCLCLALVSAAAAEEIVGGEPLDRALAELAARGLQLVWSSRAVPADARVLATPRASEPRALLDEILAPHGLGVETGPGDTLVVVVLGRPSAGVLRGRVRSRVGLEPVAGAQVLVGTALAATTDGEGRFEIVGLEPGAYALEIRRPGFVVEQRAGVEVTAPPGAALELELQPAPLAGEQITVHPSRISLLDEAPAAIVALDRDGIRALPQLGGDLFRALSLMPGTAGNDWTAQVHVRGGRRDEVLVLIDGQELYDAWHLEDYDNALSAIPAPVLATLDLTTGGFGTSRGDRMGALLDMSTRTPGAAVGARFSLSVLDAQVEAGGGGPGGARWLVSARRGATDLAARVFGEEDPSYWDLLGKLELPVRDRQYLRANLLHAADRLRFAQSPGGELRELDTRYESSYLWLAHQLQLGARRFVDSALSVSRIDRDRRGREDEKEKRFAVADVRELEVLEAQQSWHFARGRRHELRAGFDLRRYSADYDYRSFRKFDTPFAVLRAEPRDGRFDYADELDDDYLGAFVSDRWRPSESLAVEFGLRHDRHTLTDDELASPRVSLAWGPDPRTVIRAAWGLFRQSERAYEVMVQDGDTGLYPAERGEHWLAGFERRFSPAGARGVTALRVEAYLRRIAAPRPRYENLFEPFEPFDEGEVDRVRIAPAASRARGAELFLAGRGGERLEWWLVYAWAESDDRLAGRWVPRQIDQTHTVNADLDLRLPRDWRLNLAWRFHTGRPTTPVGLTSAVDAQGEPEPLPFLGPLNSDRLPAEHRLDLRLSRSWPLARGRLTAFFDAQNLYDRKNVAGYDLSIDEAAGAIVATPEPWPGFFASAGVAWEF